MYRLTLVGVEAGVYNCIHGTATSPSYIEQFTMYAVQCTPYSVHRRLYVVHYPEYTVVPTLVLPASPMSTVLRHLVLIR